MPWGLLLSVKSLEQYYEAIDAGQLPIYRGLVLSDDDLLRQKVISELICHFELEFNAIEKEFGISFKQYFTTELEELKTMQDDGLLNITNDQIIVKPTGRLLIRNICMVFDIYLRKQTKQAYSKVI